MARTLRVTISRLERREIMNRTYRQFAHSQPTSGYYKLIIGNSREERAIVLFYDKTNQHWNAPNALLELDQIGDLDAIRLDDKQWKILDISSIRAGMMNDLNHN
jgi:hypothetical protein